MCKSFCCTFLAVTANDYDFHCRVPCQAFFVVDSYLIGKVEMNKIPIVLLAAYFVFNICYCKGCYNVYSYVYSYFETFETLFFDTITSEISPTVKHLLTALNNF